MNTSYQELSWFKLSLLHFLYESHPELIDDTDLLNTRSDLASKTYSEAVKNGYNQQEAEELALKDLYRAFTFPNTIHWLPFFGMNSPGSPNGAGKRICHQTASEVEGFSQSIS